MYRDTIFQYVKKQYGTIPEYLWNDLPDSAILRNDNGKWYAVSWILGNVTRIPRHELPQTLDFSDFLPLFT